jgi:hypothetical protein
MCSLFLRRLTILCCVGSMKNLWKNLFLLATHQQRRVEDTLLVWPSIGWLPLMQSGAEQLVWSVICAILCVV